MQKAEERVYGDGVCVYRLKVIQQQLLAGQFLSRPFACLMVSWMHSMFLSLSLCSILFILVHRCMCVAEVLEEVCLCRFE